MGLFVVLSISVGVLLRCSESVGIIGRGMPVQVGFVEVAGAVGVHAN